MITSGMIADYIMLLKVYVAVSCCIMVSSVFLQWRGFSVIKASCFNALVALISLLTFFTYFRYY